MAAGEDEQPVKHMTFSLCSDAHHGRDSVVISSGKFHSLTMDKPSHYVSFTEDGIVFIPDFDEATCSLQFSQHGQAKEKQTMLNNVNYVRLKTSSDRFVEYRAGSAVAGHSLECQEQLIQFTFRRHRQGRPWAETHKAVRKGTKACARFTLMHMKIITWLPC